MSTTLETRIHIFYADPEGQEHAVVKTIWAMSDRRTVTATQIAYPNGVKFPIECSHTWIIPTEWKYIRREWQYIQQNILNTPAEHFLKVPDAEKMMLECKDLKGRIYPIIKHILGKKDEREGQWHVEAVRFSYPSGVRLLIEDYHCRTIPRGWKFTHDIQENGA